MSRAVPVLESNHDGGSRASADTAAPAGASGFEPILGLARDVHLLTLAGRPVLFSRGAEAVFELHGDSLRAAERLSAGTSAFELVAMMEDCGWPLPEAQSMVANLLMEWSRTDLLAMGDAPQAAVSGTYQIGGMLFRVSSANECTPFEPSQMFREARSSDDLVTYSLSPLLDAIAIRCPSGRVIVAPQEEAAAELKSSVIADLLQGSGAMALHAACLVSRGQAILLIGPPGAGKSTLAAGLCRAGFSYAGDDITLIRDGKALGVCVALTLKEGASALLDPQGHEGEHLPFRRRDGVRLAYEWPRDIAPQGPFPIAAIVRLDRTESAEPCLSSSDPLAAMRELLAEAYSAKGSASLAELKMLDRIVSRARPLEIRYSELGDAIALLSDEFL